MSRMHPARRALLGSAAALACVRPARAQDFPNRPVRLVIGFPPGGSNDVAARILQPRLQELLGQPLSLIHI